MTITATAMRTGLSAQRLLEWERRGFVKPLLERRGRRIVRFYGADVVQKLERIKALVDAGYRLSRAAEMAAQQEGGGVQ